MMREDYTVLSEKDEIEEFMFLGLRKEQEFQRESLKSALGGS